MADQGAPGALETVRLFVNTLDLESGEDELQTWADVVTWIEEVGLVDDVDTPGSEADLAEVREVREAFRDLLHAGSHGEDDAEARGRLNAVAERAGLHVRITDPTGTSLEVDQGGVVGALGRLVAIGIDAMNDGTWTRLKVCDNDGCAWAFYDHSRNRSGRWCSMEVCGNRMKVRAYRERTADG